MRSKSFGQGASTVCSVLSADVQGAPSGDNHALREGRAVNKIGRVDRCGIGRHRSVVSVGAQAIGEQGVSLARHQRFLQRQPGDRVCRLKQVASGSRDDGVRHHGERIEQARE